MRNHAGAGTVRTVTKAHERLAEKFMLKRYWKGAPVPDSMRSLVALAFTEEEAELVCLLGFATVPAAVIALRARRPVSEVRPILDFLADRLLITALTLKGVRTYGFLNFVPGLFEMQMIRSKDPANEGEREFFVKLASLYEQVYDEVMIRLRPAVEGRDIRFGRVIPIGKSLERSSGVLPLSSDLFSEVIDRNRSFCLVNVCACRHEHELLGNGCGKPMDVCSAMGWLADFSIERGLARRVSKEEFIDAKNRAAAAGLVNLTDNLENPLQVCSCCSCCCMALRMLKQYNIPTLIAASRFEAVVDEATCTACGKCSRACPMDAINWKKKHPPVRIDHARCIGCGICVDRCDRDRAMSLCERPSHKLPSATLLDYYADRYLELMGDDIGMGPRLRLGVSRLLARVSPFSISGPGYEPPKA